MISASAVNPVRASQDLSGLSSMQGRGQTERLIFLLVGDRSVCSRVMNGNYRSVDLVDVFSICISSVAVLSSTLQGQEGSIIVWLGRASV
jgi:hypothetical protein